MSVFDVREAIERVIPAWLAYSVVGGLLVLVFVLNVLDGRRK